MTVDEIRSKYSVSVADNTPAAEALVAKIQNKLKEINGKLRLYSSAVRKGKLTVPQAGELRALAKSIGIDA